MPRNIEIKARIDRVEALEGRVAALADRGPIVIAQDDTFFACERGRLKLRALSADEGQLIFYRRPDEAGPKESHFVIAPTASPDTLRQALSLAYGRAGRVRKHRTLYLVGRTRVHLDRVEGLGDFLELEVVLVEGEPAASGVAEAQALMAVLGIAPAQLVEGAYVDLLAGQGRKESRMAERHTPPALSGAQLERLWAEHLRGEFETKDVEATLATMVEDAYVNHMPVNTGGRGKDALRRFYRDVFIPSWPDDLVTTAVNRVVGEGQLVDELHSTFTHSRPMDWFLPNVPPTGRKIEMDLVVVVQFRGDKIASERIYWDHARVLRQAGLVKE
jgi:predicted adenylyl cyclase CyaB